MESSWVLGAAAVLPVSAPVRRALLRWCACAVVLAAPLAASAHGVKAGELLIDHPYALPSELGDTHGRAFLRGIKNASSQTERLLGASTPIASQVKLHQLKPDANGLRGMQVDYIDLPAKSTTLLRHTGDYQLSLIDLKQALKDGDRFDLTLNFERGGSQTIKVWVQKLREVPGGDHSH
jgi:copper(I)-binding protein